MSEDLEKDEGYHVVCSGDAGWMGSLDGPFKTYEEACVASVKTNVVGDDGVRQAVEVHYSDGKGGLWAQIGTTWKQMWDESRPMPDILIAEKEK